MPIVQKKRLEEEIFSEIKEDILPTVSLFDRRLIPLGVDLKTKRPIFLPWPKMTAKTYNVFTLVGAMGSGKTIVFRNLIYWIKKFSETIMIIFDPMVLEYDQLAIKEDSSEKRANLLNETMYDPDTGRNVKVVVEPDAIRIFHIVPRYAIVKDNKHGYDTVSMEIIKKDGGIIIAEDVSRMREDQLFNCLYYAENKSNAKYHFYLRRAFRQCDEQFGKGNWYINHLLDAIKHPTGHDSDISVVEDDASVDAIDDEMGEEIKDREESKKKSGLDSFQAKLVEDLTKYEEAGFFVRNADERKKFGWDFRKVIYKYGRSRVLNLSFLAFKKTEYLGEQLVAGHTDYLLETLIDISNEYYNAIRKKKQGGRGMSLTKWENFLLDYFKLTLAFEESEIFIKNMKQDLIKMYPGIKRLEYIMSLGRKFGFKNLLYLTQRVQKVNKIVFQESSYLFITGITGEDRDDILKAFGLYKIKKQVGTDEMGKPIEVQLATMVTGLDKDKHQWCFIDKNKKHVRFIQTYDCPTGVLDRVAEGNKG